MTEKEIMLSGGMYDPLDPVLWQDRVRAHKLTAELNALAFDDPFRAKKTAELLGASHEDTVISEGFHCDFGYNIYVGEGFFCNFNCVMLDTNRINIGNHCMFGPNVTLATATHPIKASERCNEQGREYALEINIGDYVWIGAGAIINPGVTIGSGAVIASGAVVTKDVPPNTLVAGVPAVVKKQIDNSLLDGDK